MLVANQPGPQICGGSDGYANVPTPGEGLNERGANDRAPQRSRVLLRLTSMTEDTSTFQSVLKTSRTTKRLRRRVIGRKFTREAAQTGGDGTDLHHTQNTAFNQQPRTF